MRGADCSSLSDESRYQQGQTCASAKELKGLAELAQDSPKWLWQEHQEVPVPPLSLVAQASTHSRLEAPA